MNHGRLLALWRTVVAFRRQFSDMKAATERDVTQIRTEIGRVSRNAHAACLGLSTNLHTAETQNLVPLHSVFLLAV